MIFFSTVSLQNKTSYNTSYNFLTYTMPRAREIAALECLQCSREPANIYCQCNHSLNSAGTRTLRPWRVCFAGRAGDNSPFATKSLVAVPNSACGGLGNVLDRCDEPLLLCCSPIAVDRCGVVTRMRMFKVCSGGATKVCGVPP